MIAIILIPLAWAIAFSGIFDVEAERIAEDNGLGGFDPDEPSIYDDQDVEFGTNEADTLIGTDGDDALFGLGQTDIIRGLAGDDLIEAGTNIDTVCGGDADSLNGEAGDDVLISGNIEIEGEGEQDVSATALAVVRTYTDDEIQEADFDALEAQGALNGVDVSFLDEAPEPTQYGDLRGGDGDDLLVLAGGDTAACGAGEDQFILN